MKRDYQSQYGRRSLDANELKVFESKQTRDLVDNDIDAWDKIEGIAASGHESASGPQHFHNEHEEQ